MNKREKEVLQAQLDKEKAVLKKLETQYQRALNDIINKTKILQVDIDALDQAIKAGDADARTLSMKRSRVYQQQYQQALKKQIEAVLDKLHSDEYSTIQEYLDKCYEDGYLGTMYDLQGQGIPIVTPIDQKAVVQAVQLDSKVVEGYYRHLGVDFDNLKKVIPQEISRGIASSLPYADIARNLHNASKAGRYNAMRIVRTEGHRIQNAATYDAQQAAKAKGCNVVKQWDSTLDGNTRPTHRALDGQIREVEEYFEVAGKEAKYPGDFGDPAEDCNCRCAVLTRAKWALGESELKTLQDRARFFGLDKTEGFEDYKKKYLKAAEEKEYKELTLDEFKKLTHKITKAERSVIYGKGHFDGYVNSSNARKINELLREEKDLPDDYREIAYTLQNVINRNTLGDDLLLTRYVHGDALESITGVKMPVATLKTKAEDFWKAVDNLPNLIENDRVYTEKGFLSTSGVTDKNVMQNKGVQLNIRAPKESNCYVTTNYKESEIIFGQNTKLKILGSRIENSGQHNWKVVLDCIIEQE